MAQTFRVLILESHRDIANLLRAFLERRGCAVVTTLEGRTALELAREWHPDLMLVDLEAPHVEELAHMLSAAPHAWPDFLVAMVNGGAAPERAAEAGVQMFLRKPIEFERLDALLAELERARRRCA